MVNSKCLLTSTTTTVSTSRNIPFVSLTSVSFTCMKVSLSSGVLAEAFQFPTYLNQILFQLNYEYLLKVRNIIRVSYRSLC